MSAASCRRAIRSTQVMAPNIWVDSIPGFRETTYALYQAFDASGR